MKKKIKVKVKLKKDCTNCGNRVLVEYYDAYSVLNCSFCGIELLPGCTAKALTVDLSKTDHYFYCGGYKWIEVN